MARSLALLALFAAVAGEQAPAQDMRGPEWTPLSFIVVKPSDRAKPGRDLEYGTRVGIRLELPGQNIVVVDRGKCEVKSFADDRGTDLTAAVPAGAVLPRPVVSAGRPAEAQPNDFTFYAPGCPAKGASKVRIKGTVTVVVGRDEKEFEKQQVELKAGIEGDFGKFRLMDPAEGGGFGAQTRVRYLGTRPLTSVTLLDAKGNEIPCRVTPTYYPAVGAAKASHTAIITVADMKKVDRCTVRVKYFDTVEEVKVPFDLEVGPGL